MKLPGQRERLYKLILSEWLYAYGYDAPSKVIYNEHY